MNKYSRSENQNISRKDIRASEDQKEFLVGFEKLWIWKKAHELMLEIHEICKHLPLEEKYKKRYQLGRSSSSVTDNIAEGHTSYYYKDKIKGLYVARKEAGETQNHLIALKDRGQLKFEKVKRLVFGYEEVIRGINGYVRWVRKKSKVSKT